MDGGDCYEASGIYLIDVKQDAVLVHGQPTLQRPPFEPYGHAWIEHKDSGYAVVVDVSNGENIRMPAWVYYRLGNINSDQCKRYTMGDLRKWIVKLGHWGPWEDD